MQWDKKSCPNLLKRTNQRWTTDQRCFDIAIPSFCRSSQLQMDNYDIVGSLKAEYITRIHTIFRKILKTHRRMLAHWAVCCKGEVGGGEMAFLLFEWDGPHRVTTSLCTINVILVGKTPKWTSIIYHSHIIGSEFTETISTCLQKRIKRMSVLSTVRKNVRYM